MTRFLSIAFAAFLSMIAAGAAYGQSGYETENVARLERADSLYSVLDARATDAREVYKDAEVEYKTSKDRYLEAKKTYKEAASAARDAKKSLNMEKKAQKARMKADKARAATRE